ncbi:MAG TPA: hypothetical protein VGB94_03595 [Acidobacteriaceae bacterium]
MKRPFAFLLTMVVLCGGAGASGKPPKAQPASTYSAVDAHPQEGVTIAVDAFDTPERTGFLRLNYLQKDLMLVRVIVTNTSDRVIQMDDVRMQFISADNDRIPAATPEEVERRMSDVRDPSHKVWKSPIPLPQKAPKIKKVEQDMAEFSFNALQVQPHTTQAGFLWYDVSGLATPVLRGAQIYVKMVKDADGKDLFPFTIPFQGK